MYVDVLLALQIAQQLLPAQGEKKSFFFIFLQHKARNERPSVEEEKTTSAVQRESHSL